MWAVHRGVTVLMTTVLSRPVVKVLHGDVNITLGSAARFAEALKLDFFPDLRDENGNSYAVDASITSVQ